MSKEEEEEEEEEEEHLLDGGEEFADVEEEYDEYQISSRTCGNR